MEDLVVEKAEKKYKKEGLKFCESEMVARGLALIFGGRKSRRLLILEREREEGGIKFLLSSSSL